MNRSRLTIFCVLVTVFCGCAARRPFRVVRADPQYALRAPDATEAPFGETLRRFNGFVFGHGSVNLRPAMKVRVENAYYKEGSARRGLEGFLGTEVAEFQVEPSGRLRAIPRVEGPAFARPAGDPPATALVRAEQLARQVHVFYLAVVFRQATRGQSSVLLSADSEGEMEQMKARLASDPDAFCAAEKTGCTAFPSTSTASAVMQIVVNKSPVSVGWGTILANVAPAGRKLVMFRRFKGRRTPVEIGESDAMARQLPLLPGDEIHFEGPAGSARDLR